MFSAFQSDALQNNAFQIVRVNDPGVLGGKAYFTLKGEEKHYAFEHPYARFLRAKKEAVEIKEAVELISTDRAVVEKELKNVLLTKKQIKKLEKNLLSLDLEAKRLYSKLQTLEALIKRLDDEDAILALALSMPFSMITL